MLTKLEYATDELTSATAKAQSLLTEFGLEVENAELDGITPPAAFDDVERKQLKSIIIATRAALRNLTELEALHE